MFLFLTYIQMSLSTDVSVPPFEFPLPRSVHYELSDHSVPTDIYSICVVASSHTTNETIETHCGNYAAPYAFEELKELYQEYNAQGGFVFPIQSIALRLKTMDRVLCWFGFYDNIKYTCYISKVGCSTSAQS